MAQPQYPGQQYPGQPQYPEQGKPARPGFAARAGKVLLRRLVGYGVGLAVVLGFGGVTAMCGKESKKHDQNNVTFAAAGQCLRVDDFSSFKPKFARVDCSDPSATIIRVADRGSCEKDGYIEYSEGSDKACLARNFQDGQCYDLPKLSGAWSRISCADARSKPYGYKVKRIDGKNDPNPQGCQENDAVYNYPDPLVTYCLTKGSNINP